MPQTSDSQLTVLEGQFEADGIVYLLIQFVDIHGAAKVKLIPAGAFRSAVEVGAGFAGGAVWGMGQGPHSHDLCARADPESYTPLPYEPGVARFAADLHVDGLPHPYCPRVNLRRVVDRARELGYVFNVGVEPEFFLGARNSDGSITGWDPHGVDDLAKPCYDFKGMSAALDFLRAINDGLNSLGWGAYQADHEGANSQYEINFKYADAVTTADRLIFFRMMTCQVAHMQYHLADASTGENVFEDAKDSRGLGLSALAYHFLGGIVAHAKALTAITSPTVNCYKRLQMGSALTGSRSGFTWVPAFIAYGDNNRTQMLRVCEPGHVEDRSASSACNPYLAIAAYLAAGLDGIAGKLDPGEPNLGNLYESGPESMAARGVRTLPQSLNEALDHLEADAVVRESLGAIADEFLKLKREEWRDYHAHIGAWELQRYLTAL